MILINLEKMVSLLSLRINLSRLMSKEAKRSSACQCSHGLIGPLELRTPLLTKRSMIIIRASPWGRLRDYLIRS
jgi:hypothetical protein